MMHFIEPHYLLALAFVVSGKASMSGKEVSEFRARSQDALRRGGLNASFLCSSVDFDSSLREHGDCFGELDDGKFYIRKVDDEVLTRKFLAYLSNDVLTAVCKEFNYTG